MKKSGPVQSFARAILERDLRAKSSVARFGLLARSESYVQTSLCAMPERAQDDSTKPAQCNHVGTGREPQKRLFAPGFNSICVRCGAVTED